MCLALYVWTCIAYNSSTSVCLSSSSPSFLSSSLPVAELVLVILCWLSLIVHLFVDYGTDPVLDVAVNSRCFIRVGKLILGFFWMFWLKSEGDSEWSRCFSWAFEFSRCLDFWCDLKFSSFDNESLNFSGFSIFLESWFCSWLLRFLINFMPALCWVQIVYYFKISNA